MTVLYKEIQSKVVGRKIVKFNLYPFWDVGRQKHYDPVIELDNGVRILFLTTELIDGADYGIEPILNTTELERREKDE